MCATSAPHARLYMHITSRCKISESRISHNFVEIPLRPGAAYAKPSGPPGACKTRPRRSELYGRSAARALLRQRGFGWPCSCSNTLTASFTEVISSSAGSSPLLRLGGCLGLRGPVAPFPTFGWVPWSLRACGPFSHIRLSIPVFFF